MSEIDDMGSGALDLLDELERWASLEVGEPIPSDWGPLLTAVLQRARDEIRELRYTPNGVLASLRLENSQLRQTLAGRDFTLRVHEAEHTRLSNMVDVMRSFAGRLLERATEAENNLREITNLVPHA